VVPTRAFRRLLVLTDARSAGNNSDPVCCGGEWR
jgi:hypothetical protein